MELPRRVAGSPAPRRRRAALARRGAQGHGHGRGSNARCRRRVRTMDRDRARMEPAGVTPGKGSEGLSAPTERRGPELLCLSCNPCRVPAQNSRQKT